MIFNIMVCFMPLCTHEKSLKTQIAFFFSSIAGALNFRKNDHLSDLFKTTFEKNVCQKITKLSVSALLTK